MGQGLCICGIKLDHPRIVSQRAVQILLFFASGRPRKVDGRVVCLERQRGVIVGNRSVEISFALFRLATIYQRVGELGARLSAVE